MVLIDAEWMPLSSELIRNLILIRVPDLYPPDYDDPEKSEMGSSWKAGNFALIPLTPMNSDDTVRSVFVLPNDQADKRHSDLNRLGVISEKGRKSEKVRFPLESHRKFSLSGTHLEFGSSTCILDGYNPV